MSSAVKVLLSVLTLFIFTKQVSTLQLSSLKIINITDVAHLDFVEDNDKTLYIPENLIKQLEMESEVWHWTPWLRTRTVVFDHVVHQMCSLANPVESFPDSLFTDDQLRQGAFLLYILFGMYAFTLLAIVCNDYFIPCVEMICEDLNIPQNVAAATFMSVATSCPEFFVNVISTFLTESDMGIGTIVGSAIFNALGVAAIGGIAAVTPIAIEMRPVTRDVVIYMINVSVLVTIVWDGQVDWYEAMVLGILYIFYFIVMFNSMKLFQLYDYLIGKCYKNNTTITRTNVNGDSKSLEGDIDNKSFENVNDNEIPTSEKFAALEKGVEGAEKEPDTTIWKYPIRKSAIYQIWWLYSWPLKFVLGMTIPSPLTCRKFYPLAFFMCIIWIGVNSFFVTWSMTVLGHVFLIPDSVMGMTFLAFGGCLPEACSIFIMSRRGDGGMGVSNALGANSLAILFALGVPWLIRTLTLVAQGSEETAVYINSAGIDFVVGSLLVAVSCLWITLFLGKFMLRKGVGAVLAVLYLIFIMFAILVETGVILERGIVLC